MADVPPVIPAEKSPTWVKKATDTLKKWWEKPFKTTHHGVSDAVGDSIGALGDRGGSVIGNTFKGAKNIAAAGTGVVTGAVAGVFRNPGKAFKLTGALLVVGAVVGGIVHLFRRKKEEDMAVNMSEAMPLPVPAQTTLMGQTLTPGEHAQRVLMARGGVAPELGAVNPAMTAVPEESVQNLGNSRSIA